MKSPALLTAFCACAVPASAALEVSLAPSVQNAAPGAELVFSGTLTNTAPAGKLFLNDISAALAGPSAAALSLDSPAFFSNVPGILLPGESYTGVLFRITLDSTAAAGDFAGTITFSGGPDILAAEALQSTNFSVLSPAVSVTATDSDAGEFGPDTASLTISRTGATGIPLPVSWTLHGASAAFLAVPPGLTIPAGTASTILTLTPIPNNTSEGDRSLTLTLQSSAQHRLAADADAATVTLHDKPADAWRLQHFGPDANTAAAADSADWDLDGNTNLLEYALGLDPLAYTSPLLPPPPGLILTYIPNPAAADVTYIVEASTDLLTWSPASVEPSPPPPNSPPGTLAFRPLPVLEQRAFLRLRVER